MLSCMELAEEFNSLNHFSMRMQNAKRGWISRLCMRDIFSIEYSKLSIFLIPTYKNSCGDLAQMFATPSKAVQRL